MNPNEPLGEVMRVIPNYQTPYWITLKDGTECLAMLIRLNKYCGKKDVWKRLDDVPRKQRYISPKEVIDVR